MSPGPGASLEEMLRSGPAAGAVAEAIRREAAGLGHLRLMEVCGTHTMAIRRSGLPALLPPNIELLSGPGCPVCVTPNRLLDHAIALARQPETVITTFGDMLRVPGTHTNLSTERAAGADVRVVYSPRDALDLAAANPARRVVFLAIGFETTAPTVAAAAREARGRGLTNFFLLVAHKLVPPALEALLGRDDFAVDGFLMPGHVSAVIGSDAYRPVAQQHGVPCVVAGFEPVDVLLAIWMLVRQRRSARAEVEIEYRTAVRPAGNPHALELMRQVFEPVDSVWRGLGSIPHSGLALRPEWAELDAARHFPAPDIESREPAGCRCGEILVGALRPPDCPLFGHGCTPEQPIGPCMVSSEGTCAAYYRYAAD